MQTREVASSSLMGAETECWAPRTCEKLGHLALCDNLQILIILLDDITSRAERLLGQNLMYLSSIGRQVSGWNVLKFSTISAPMGQGLREVGGVPVKMQLLEIFLPKTHIAEKRFSKHLVPFLGLSMSKMKYNLSDLLKVTLKFGGRAGTWCLHGFKWISRSKDMNIGTL